MKRLLVAIIAVASLTANAATFQENLAAGNIAEAAIQLNYSTNNTMLVTTPELAKQLYTAACATQAWDQADVAAQIAYKLGDKTTMQNWLDLAATLKKPGRIYFQIWGQSMLDPDKTGPAYKEYTTKNGVKKKDILTFTYLEPEMMLDFCKKAAAAGNMDAAAIACVHLQTEWYNTENGKNTDSGYKPTWMPYFTADWAKFIADNFGTAAQVEALTFKWSIMWVLEYWHRVEWQEEYVAGNTDAWKSGVKTTPLYTDVVLTKIAEVNEFGWIPASYEVYLKYWKKVCEVGNVKRRIEAAKILDRNAKNKDASKAVFSFVAKNSTWSQTADFALYIGDADIILDTFVKIDTTATAAQIDAIIPIFNSFDAGYRSADLATALKNINKKYTLKLYDDRDTWEPILSKIRAMIDTL